MGPRMMKLSEYSTNTIDSGAFPKCATVAFDFTMWVEMIELRLFLSMTIPDLMLSMLSPFFSTNYNGSRYPIDYEELGEGLFK